MNTYECSECGEDVPVSQDDLNYTECPHCKTKFTINADAEFVDSMWQDRTTITKI
jgi:DNA-directed RNA polymerase subunit RPC12/RpoP